MPIEIGPDGTPIVTPATSDFVASTTESESLHPSVDSSVESGSDEGTSETGSTDGKPATREAFMKEVSDIVRRYTSDTQSFQKCVAEIDALIPE